MMIERKFDPTREELKGLYQQYTLQEIANRFEVSQETVRKRLHELGLEARRTGPARRFKPSAEELERLYQTMSMREIADAYGVGETVVFNRLKEHGIVLSGFENGGHRKKTGKIFSETHRDNLAKSLRAIGRGGAANPRWNGGTTDENLRLRRSGAYAEWKRKALELRGSKCQECGINNRHVCECCGTLVVLHVHHVKSFADYPDIRFDPQNSEVLCPKCHWTRHKSKSGETGNIQNGQPRRKRGRAKVAANL